MRLFLVSYDLRKRHRDYDALYEALSSYKIVAKPLESVYVIDVNSTAKAIRDYLRQHIDDNDGLLVLELSGPGAWSKIDDSNALVEALNALIAAKA